MGVEEFPSRVRTTTATIAASGSLSAAVDLAGCTLCRISMPSAWTTANLTFSVSYDGTTYNDLYDQYGTEVTVTAAASRTIYLPPSEWAGIRFVKVRSGTSATPVTQEAERALILVTRPV